MSIASEITRLQTAKADIKAAIEGKGVTVPSVATLDDYADYVDAISSGSGTLSITQNGTYDVTQYASAEVNVSGGGGGGVQTGTFTIASNTKTVTISLDDADIKFIVATAPNPTQADPDAGGWKTTMILYFPSENLSKSFTVYTSGNYFSANNLSAIVDGNDITFNTNYYMKAGDTFTWYAG